MALRIGHFADSHLGYRYGRKLDPEIGINQRTFDAENAFLDCVEQMIKVKVQVAVHAGDLFDQPRPSWRSITTAMRGLNDLSDSGIEVVVIAGNHDTSAIKLRDDVFSVLREGCPFAHFASREQQYVKFPALDIAFNLIPSAALKQEALLSRSITNNFLNVMVVHGLASDIPHAERLSRAGESEVPDSLAGSLAYDYIALGDWHRSQQIRENAWYSGATERFGWGDRLTQPGWLEATLSPRRSPIVKPHMLDTRPMIQLPAVAGNQSANDILKGMELWFNAAEPTKDAMIRINVDHPTSDALMREVQRLAVNRKFPCLMFQITQTKKDKAEQLVLSDASLPGKIDVQEAFSEFTSQMQKTNEFKTAFQAKGSAALAVAIQRESDRSLMED